MKYIFVLLVVIINCSSLSLSANTNVEVVGMNYPPNYKYSLAKKDDLTDGVYRKRYLWVNNKSAVWQNVSPIILNLAVLNHKLIGKSGVLRLHTASSPKADLYPPRFIDVYKKENGLYIPIAFRYLEFDESNENHDLWLDVFIGNIPENIVLVAHAEKQFLAVDEISIVGERNEENRLVNIASDALPVKDSLVVSSIDRLKNILRQKIPNKYRSNIIMNYENHAVTLRSCKSDCKNIVKISGYSGEEESVQIVTPDRECMINYEDSPGLQVYLQDEVMSLDGQVVNDIVRPIQPLDQKVKGNAIFKISLIFDKQVSDKEVYPIRINCDETKEHLVEIHSHRTFLDLTSSGVDVNVWAYPSHFDRRVSVEEVYADLRQNGVTFVTIHPSNIPFKYDDSDKIERFIQIISGVPDDFKILLFLDLNGMEGDIASLHGNRVKLEEWLEFIQKLMSDATKLSSDWILYPIDEARKSQIATLYDFSSSVKKAQSYINIYANPINDSSGKVSRRQLNKLKKVIDYWQPSIKLAEENAGFFKNTDNYFIYENPTYPSKSEKTEFFRKLPLRALCLGASGVGFWAYNENGGTSPYDDFDGKNADWSVVYMKNGQLLRSARWDAFKEGIDDYKLFRYGLSRYSQEIQNELSSLCSGLNSKDWIVHLYKLRNIIINNK